jgi:hypothetical protein
MNGTNPFHILAQTEHSTVHQYKYMQVVVGGSFGFRILSPFPDIIEVSPSNMQHVREAKKKKSYT